MGEPLKIYLESDRLFAKIDGRRNAYLLQMMISSIFNKPFIGFYTSLVHSLVTVGTYLCQPFKYIKKVNEKIEKWMEIAGLKKY